MRRILIDLPGLISDATLKGESICVIDSPSSLYDYNEVCQWLLTHGYIYKGDYGGEFLSFNVDPECHLLQMMLYLNSNHVGPFRIHVEISSNNTSALIIVNQRLNHVYFNALFTKSTINNPLKVELIEVDLMFRSHNYTFDTLTYKTFQDMIEAIDAAWKIHK